jgi:hypothetical protein
MRGLRGRMRRSCLRRCGRCGGALGRWESACGWLYVVGKEDRLQWNGNVELMLLMKPSGGGELAL